MNVLVIDNYDSFVYNIVQAIGKLGHDVTLRENDDLNDVDPNEYARIIISPGPGNPTNPHDRGDVLEFLSKSVNAKVLGICFGHQLLAHHLGGEIKLGRVIRHGEIDLIRHFGGSMYRNIPEKFSAVRYHSLVVDAVPGAVIDSVSITDGQIMGFHSTDGKYYGIQFHPESYYTEYGERLISNFLEA
ncbi:MAG: aminodeoxychorismate/anthranilate synthase component II [Candidatus Thermoplasmatota archaeon]|nr:aminodeoxychorismate/anthranilate synthase component II [Candidatus Thermoplasmatota archaeon]MCL5665265.1 aminodeoxychorismate/anthranilate synthase component II [Candidatus Thermoplasmatota archaeon]